MEETGITVQEPVQDTLFSLEDLAVTTTESVNQLKNELKSTRQMVKDIYSSSETYTTQEGRVTGEKKQLADIKQEIDNRPEVAVLLAKQKELQTALKEKEQSISDYAIEYERIGKVNQIVRGDTVYDIVKKAKLVKRLQ